MMTRRLLCTLLLLAAPAVFAQTADMRISSLVLSNEPAVAGELFTITMKWRNQGPDTAHFILLLFTGNPTPFFVQSVATSGWPCYPNTAGSSYSCQNAELAVGAEAEIVLRLRAPATAGAFTLRAEVRAAEADPSPANNVMDRTWTLAASPEADIAITPSAQTHGGGAGETITMPLSIRNNGPNDVSNVTAYFSVPVTSNIPHFTISGGGWSCGNLAYGPQAVVCTRSILHNGERTALTLQTTVPANPETYTISMRVAGERYTDPEPNNNFATATVRIGPEPPPQVEWERILVPLTADDFPGANNSLWRTETTALIASETMIDVTPLICNLMPGPPLCTVPLGKSFDAKGQLIFTAWPNGQFIDVRKEHAPKLRLNSRVWDVSRETETAGSEIPIAREHDFTTGSLSLLGIPVAPHYRHTLRVYDLEGKGGAQVRVKLFANDETQPRAEVVRALTAAQINLAGTSHPAYLQLDPATLTSLAGVQTIRIDVEPAEPGLRIWSFLSVTNNETHHVTTFSAQ